MLIPPSRARSIPLVVVLSAAAGAAGCGLRSQVVPVLARQPLRPANIDEVRSAYDALTRALHSLSASGHLVVRDLRAGRQREFGVRLLAGRGPRLYLKASVAVVTALEAVADGKRFWLQVPSRRKVWTGDAARARAIADAAEPYDALRPADLVGALLPEPLEIGPGEGLYLEADREWASLVLTAAGSGGQGHVRRRVWLDRQTLELRRTRRYDEHGGLESEASFAEWREGAPRRVGLARADGYELHFSFDRAQANAALPERAFQPRLPAGYEVVDLDDAR